MAQILGSKKRKGFTLVEEVVVIAVIAILAIPLATLLNQSIQAQIYGTKDVKGQYYANLIMQDFERRIRRADSGSIVITTGNPYEVGFTYMDSDRNGKATSSVKYKYRLENPGTKDALLYRNDGSGYKIFPTGLEKGIIQNFEIDESKSNLDTSNPPPYYIYVEIETGTGTILQKTIYLVNYHS